MKKIMFALIAIAVIVAVMASCKKVNPVRDTEPVTNAFYTDANGNENFPLAEFHKLGEAGDTLGQIQLVEKYRKQLTANVVRQYPEIQDEKNIKFVLGSGYAKDVESGDSKLHSGNFDNELIIVINDPQVKRVLFLTCGNGAMAPIDFSDQHDLGTAAQWRFTIQEGEGLAHHLPALQAWAEIANNLSIPIKDKDGKVVSQETYLNYLGSYTTGLRTGDVIDVIAGKVYDKNGNEVNFNRRQQQTKRANKALKNKRK